MASAHPLSAPGANSSLQLFNVPVTYVSIVSSKWVDYEPVQTGTNPIEFVIKPLADYIDINKTELRLVVKITKQDGSPTGDGKKYTLVNNALHSIIKQFTIKINETLVTEQNEVDNTAESNEGLNRRATFTNNGTEVVGVPLCDVFHIDKLLLDGLEIKVKVDLNNDAFVLMDGETPNNCKLMIMSSTLRIRTVRVADSVKLEHVQIMQGHKGSAPLPAIYTLTRTPTQARIIPQGVLNHTETDLFHGFIPQCIIFGLVRNDAFNGNLARNPFNFELFDLQGIRLTVNGEEMPYSYSRGRAEFNSPPGRWVSFLCSCS
ncbi:uncharacterized protein F54H12.2-like [Montipora capricornis]|uniref:uncharacterized protein F54H12.2-like n=1 Tax=Montipora capricornis TaxID=246305 RepID=UPI0035F104B7